MLNILITIHIIVALMLVISILLQKTTSDGSLGGLAGAGVMSAKSASNFLIRITIVLTGIFFINAIALANLSSKANESKILKAIEK